MLKWKVMLYWVHKSFNCRRFILKKLREVDTLKNWQSILYAVVLALVAMVTGEIVTFIMLGFILMSLQNIHRTLKRMLELKEEDKSEIVTFEE